VIVAYVDLSGHDLPLFLRCFDAGNGSPLGVSVRAAPSSGSLWSEVVPAPEGPLLYPAREATPAIDPQTLRAVRRYPVGGSTAAISPDGATLATRPVEQGLTRVRVAI
jgi:hypothetical protein